MENVCITMIWVQYAKIIYYKNKTEEKGEKNGKIRKSSTWKF